MRLLVITQAVDLNDTDLGFFHEWLVKLAERATSLKVVCLKKGAYTLPSNVQIYSLGKENGYASAIFYAYRFYKILWQLRGQYDAVFVHMNPEYVILAGPIWRLAGKKVLLWYTHKAVNLRLWIAEKFVNKIFTASADSFRLSSKKVVIVGHGIRNEQFSIAANLPPQNQVSSYSFINVGRITPIKDQATVIRALADLRKRAGLPKFTIKFVGNAITKQDEEYKAGLYALDRKLSDVGNHPLSFTGVSHDMIAREYQNSHVLIHTSRTGSLDKVVLEALATGRIVVSSSEAFRHLAANELKNVVFYFPPGDWQALANTLEHILKSGILENANLPNQKAMAYVKRNHNLDIVVRKITEYFAQ